jgi:hypothetical protein
MTIKTQMLAVTVCGLVLPATTPAASAAEPPAVFQYAVSVETARGNCEVFLWIPPAAQQVRGLIMGGMTLAERELANDPVIRRACAQEQLAIVFLRCGLGAVDVQRLLDELAAVSGYSELSVAPLFFAGHSAGGPAAKSLAARMAERCFGLMQYRGGVPGGGDPLPPGVPALAMVGQFDEFGGLMRDENGREGAWERPRNDIAAYRAQDHRHLASIAVEPGAGHFAWSDRNAAYLAMFIRKAARARIPDWPVTAAQPVGCKPIDHTTGWLTSLELRTLRAAVPWTDNEPDRANTAWHFDREMAEANVAYHAGLAGKKDQFIKWNDPYWVDAGARYFFTRITWVGDGQSFKVHPQYAGTYPQPHKSGGPRWLEAGQPVGHSTAPIRVKRVGGPIVVTGPDTFRMRYDALAPATGAGRVTFMAYSVGDDQYRHTEQVGMLPRGFSGLKSGKAQTISFPPIGNLKPDSPPVELRATSDSGLPVEYYVAVGPAIITDGKLKLTDIPARARFPIEIKVVAWQFGSGIEPLVQTAAPVEQTIQLEKP